MAGYETIAVEPLTPVIGAEVRGLDLRAPLTDAQCRDVHEALVRHLVLFFRDQPVSEEEQLAFAARFGPLVANSMNDEPDGAGLFVTLEDTADDPPKADRWHTDIPFAGEPPDVAVLAILATPPTGGDTMWASLYAVHEGLSPAMQQLLAGLDLDTQLGTSAEVIRQMRGEEYYQQVMANFVGARHPLVRVHPVSGRPAVYLSGSFMKGVAGMHPDESDVLLAFLQSRLDDPNVSCRWRWQPHDVAMWDERCTNHRALSDHYPSYRKVRRCLAGRGRPVGVDGRLPEPP